MLRAFTTDAPDVAQSIRFNWQTPDVPLLSAPCDQGAVIYLSAPVASIVTSDELAGLPLFTLYETVESFKGKEWDTWLFATAEDAKMHCDYWRTEDSIYTVRTVEARRLSYQVVEIDGKIAGWPYKQNGELGKARLSRALTHLRTVNGDTFAVCRFAGRAGLVKRVGTADKTGAGLWRVIEVIR